MKPRAPFRLPEEQDRQERRGVRLEYWTLFFLATIVVVMYFSLGGSQAMRTAWLEDLLGFVPPLAFLAAHHVRRKRPNQRFPFGFQKASTIAYLVASTAILLLGLYVVYDAVGKLIARSHPTIGLVSLFGVEFWMGWLMIAALAYSMIPPVILGRMKLPIARSVNDETLLADARMQKADWMTAVAGIVGIVGIGFGYWWADSVAASLIALDVLHDGGRHTWRSLKMLIDEEPQTTGGKARPSPVIDEVRETMQALPWAEDVELRFREEGATITGIVFVTPREGARQLLDRLDEARAALEGVSWRLYDVEVVLRKGQEGA